MAESGVKVTLADGHQMSIRGHSSVSMEVRQGINKARIVLGDAVFVLDLTDIHLSVREVDLGGDAVVFVSDACYILTDGAAVVASGVLNRALVIGSVSESDSGELYVAAVTASEIAASTLMEVEAELWHRSFNHLGVENRKRVLGLVDGISMTVADAKRGPGTFCRPCVGVKMAPSPHHRWTTTTSMCDPVHSDVDRPLTV